MENKEFKSDNIRAADLQKSWHIPRPTLARSSNSHGSTSSNNSTQSARSGSLLLTAANLAQIQNEDNAKISNRNQNIQYYLQQQQHQQLKNKTDLSLEKTIVNEDAGGGFNNKIADPDSISMASSMHFTVVNVNAKPVVRQRSFCRKHQLTILVLTMSTLFTIGILLAIYLLNSKIKNF